jgi:phospholipid transport system substrate-binding protein
VNPRWLPPLAAFLVMMQGAAFASTAEAERRLQMAVNEVIRIAGRARTNSALAESLHPVLPKYMSFDAMTRRAIGPGWRQFTPDQQRKAVQLFTTLVIRKYSSKFTLGENPVVKYKTASVPAPGRVEVPTTLLYQGTRYNVTYRLEEAEDWRITDVVVEGVSFVATYRTQFDAQFKKGGTTEILSALSQSVARPQ